MGEYNIKNTKLDHTEDSQIYVYQYIIITSIAKYQCFAFT